MKALPTLGFIEALKLASSRIVDFSGRSRRSEFWWWMLVVILAQWIITAFLSGWVSFIVGAGIMFLGLATTARRLHDSGKSAIWVYISYALGIAFNIFILVSPLFKALMELAADDMFASATIDYIVEEHRTDAIIYALLSVLAAIIGLVVIIMCLLDSKPEANKYGPSPKYVED